MEGLNYWQQFLSTGSVEDYLNFRKIQGNTTEDYMVMGDNPYAGVCEVNRDCIEDSAYRGIR